MSKPRPSPLSIRLSDDERAALVAKAAGRPLGAFIKDVVLSESVRPVRRRAPVQNSEALGRALALLGRTHLSNNLNQLARAANLGALPVTDQLEAELRAACADIRLMRSFLLAALGIAAPDGPAGLSAVFGEAAKGGDA